MDTYFLLRDHTSSPRYSNDSGMFILILLVGATVATAAFIAIGGYWT